MSIRSKTRLRRAPSCTSRARTLVAVFMTLAGAASALAAQGGRRGGGGADPSAPSRPTVAPVLWEPEQIFPLALAHSSDLKLTDEQRVQIETISIEAAREQRAAPQRDRHVEAGAAPASRSGQSERADGIAAATHSRADRGSRRATSRTRRCARAAAREHSPRARSDDAADDSGSTDATRGARNECAHIGRARRSGWHRRPDQRWGRWSRRKSATEEAGASEPTRSLRGS